MISRTVCSHLRLDPHRNPPTRCQLVLVRREPDLARFATESVQTRNNELIQRSQVDMITHFTENYAVPVRSFPAFLAWFLRGINEPDFPTWSAFSSDPEPATTWKTHTLRPLLLSTIQRAMAATLAGRTLTDLGYTDAVVAHWDMIDEEDSDSDDDSEGDDEIMEEVPAHEVTEAEEDMEETESEASSE